MGVGDLVGLPVTPVAGVRRTLDLGPSETRVTLRMIRRH
jgi:hypothetical protein